MIEMKGLDNFHTEFDGYYKGYRYVVIFQRIGFRCGYVEIPANSNVMLNIKENKPDSYESINSIIDCHGGVTYVDYNNNSYPVSNNNGFWIGFNTCHYKDETDKEHTKSFEYVVTECKNIINQILLFDSLEEE